MLAPRQWQNRIVGHGEEAAEQLLANPKNWRIHPKAQQAALQGVLSKVGWVQSVIVNQRTGFVVDGHARVALAITAGERVPVVYVDLSEEEEAAVIATLDPLGAMAGKDEAIWSELLSGMDEAYKALALAAMPARARARAGAVGNGAPAILKGAALADLAPSVEERETLAGRRLLIEYSGGKDSSAAAIWVRHYFPDNPAELVFVDMGSDYVGFHLYLHDAARFLGLPLTVLRSKQTVLDAMLAKGEWPNPRHPYCHEVLHEPLDDCARAHKPDEIAMVRGGRLAERAATGKQNASRFMMVDRMKDYVWFQPLYFSDKGMSERILAEVGLPIWDGYARGLCRTACRVCPGQKPRAYAAIRREFPDVWAELLDLERRFGPGGWSDPANQHSAKFEESADRGLTHIEAAA